MTARSIGGSPTVIALEEHWWPAELADAWVIREIGKAVVFLSSDA